jgi:hypothetical protein
VLGPNVIAKWDRELSAVDGIGLAELEMDRALTLVLDYTLGAVRGAARERWVKESTGMTDNEWWSLVEPHMTELLAPDAGKYPVASRVGPIVGEAYGAHDPAGSFAFGLECLLDGLAAYIARRQTRKPKPRRRGSKT